MQILKLPGTYIKKHLGVLIINSRVEGMIDRFKKEKGNEISRMYSYIRINN